MSTATEDVEEATIEHPVISHREQRAVGKLKKLRKLFPHVHKQGLGAPVTTVLSLVCDLGGLSFRAYNDPTVDGFDEVTITGNRVKHLNYNILDHCVEGALKIYLQRARNVIDADLFTGKSDPYVVFSTGWSQVASATIDNTEHPVWNSTHYLLVRKPSVCARDDKELHIKLYDSDVAWGKNDERNFRQALIRDDFLGSASINLEEIKKPGVHEKEITLHLNGDKRANKTVIIFTVEFIPFSSNDSVLGETRHQWVGILEACEELGKLKDSGSWSRCVEANGTFKWDELQVDSQVRHIIFQPIAFINCMKTGTQVWIHINRPRKTVAIAFRGTEANRLKDLLTDLNFLPAKLRWDNDGSCALRLTEHAVEERIRVHSGFRGAYMSVWSTIMTIVSDVSEWSNEWTIYATGHSLGGALATLCAFEYANRITYEGKGPRILLMNFGAPRIGNIHFKRAFRVTVPDSYRVVNRLDIIHQVPIFLRHVPREVSFEEDGEVILDKRHSIKLDVDESIPEMESHESKAPVKKLTKKKILKTPGFKGHFEDYYFNVVTTAIASVFKGHKDEMRRMIDDLHHPEIISDEESGEPSHTNTAAGESSHTNNQTSVEQNEDRATGSGMAAS